MLQLSENHISHLRNFNGRYTTEMANSRSDIIIEKYRIPRYERIPNTSLHGIPLIHYKSAFPKSTDAGKIGDVLRTNSWTPSWRYTMYTDSHFHSTTHEALVVISGAAKILLGGDDNPDAVTITANTGDAMFMPAGVAHRLLEDIGGRGEGFTMVGAYPVGGEEWDMCYGRGGEEGVDEKVKGVGGVEVQDPVSGGVLGGGE
ncbi:uncharacterized protein DFL_009610 [Arthrobotrys flagrans]|uniref:Uncharacterized protein n=1 Tax=Arthrobotrys flagrans TaxID=97331 RepID=A0A436ZS49_ARTFL|nr:hypothetical protein DFL_009610 [Arthrobotrys flagrans]